MKQQVSPETRRRQNVAAFWQQRFDRAPNHAELARVCFDRARSAARRGERAGYAPQAMYDLAELLTDWAEQLEHAERDHARRHAS